MKRALIAFMLIYSTCTAGIFGRVEIGPSTYFDMYFTDIFIGYRFSFLGVISETYGGTTTWAYSNYSESWRGRPFEDIYSIGQRFRIGGFFIHAKHYCAHQVYHKKSESQDGPATHVFYTVAPDWWNGNITTISAGYEWEIK